MNSSLVQNNSLRGQDFCPRSYTSGGVSKSAHITAGNKYLKTILYQCGGTTGCSKSPTFSDLYNRISRKRSKEKAIIACVHRILRIAYKILSDQTNRVNEKSSLEGAIN
ncbi:transposase [Enterococcus sp. JM4C]|uniref:transposase n=1 Tax=Candidatus Enterococcus huntleyi TaxID=1857217 RepID=UPI00137A8F69